MENENKQSLIKRLFTKLQPAKIVKKLATLTLALGIALGTTACSNTPNNNTNPGTTPPTTEQGGNEQGGGNQNDYSQYSPLLQGVLTDDYYNLLIDQAKANPNIANKGHFDPHPYGFLEDEGYDINKIKNNEIECLSTSYLDNKNFYIQTKVENKATTDYYSCYTLKYTLSNDEIDDLNKLFPAIGGTTYKYYQAPLFIQEISNQKTASVISKAHLTKTCHEALLNKINNVSGLYFKESTT